MNSNVANSIVFFCLLFFGVVVEDTQESIKEQQREGYCKAACDASKGVADDILPHILNL